MGGFFGSSARANNLLAYQPQTTINGVAARSLVGSLTIPAGTFQINSAIQYWAQVAMTINPLNPAADFLIEVEYANDLGITPLFSYNIAGVIGPADTFNLWLNLGLIFAELASETEFFFQGIIEGKLIENTVPTGAYTNIASNVGVTADQLSDNLINIYSTISAAPVGTVAQSVAALQYLVR